MEPRAYWKIIFFCFFLFQMIPSAEIIRTTHLPHFGLKNQFKIVLI